MRRRGADASGRKRVGEHHDGSFGVYMSHKIQKLRGQNEAFTDAAQPPSSSTPQSATPSGSCSTLFQGVHVYVDGYTVPSKEEIRHLMLLHGGGFEHYDTSRVTHIIATHLPASKLLQLKKMKKPLPVVHPDWIVQSIEQKRVLPVQPFLYAGFADPTQSSFFSLSGLPAAHGRMSMSGSMASLSGNDTSKSSSVHDAKLLAEPEQSVVTAEIDEDEKMAQTLGSDGSEDGGDWDILAGEEEDEYEAKRAVTETVELLPTVEGKGRPNTAAKTRTNSTRDGPEFVKHFFAKSRLHHIGTWRTTFQQKATEFQAKYKGGSVIRAPASSNERVILHVDMDCFFVAVAVRGRPELQNVPVAVAHSSNAGSSEISSCNYLARGKGVGAGMFMQTAKDLCPELVVLPYKFDAIEQVSFQIYDIFFSHTPLVQAVSCDEAFLEFGKGTDGMEKATAIRHEIFEQTGCAASVGVSFNVLLAKLSSKKAKPDSIHQIGDRSQAEKFVMSLKIRDLPGVGYKTGAKLENLGVEDVRQLSSISKPDLVRSIGKTAGEMLFDYARGIDVHPLSIESNMMRKSVSAVVNFGIRFEKWEDATAFLMALGEELSHRLRSLKVRTKSLTFLIKKRRPGQPVEPTKFMGHGICDNFTKTQVLGQPTHDEEVIGKACIELLRQLDIPSEELRGVGVQATKLVSDAPSGNQRSGQLFKAWLTESAQQPTNAAPSSRLKHGDGYSNSEEQSNVNAGKSDFAATTFSQINMDVLEELPHTLRQEILESYGRGQASAASRQPDTVNRRSQPKQKTNGKAPLRRKHPARNIFEPNIRKEPRTDDALDDIRMSQVDSEVYHSLPYGIRREIDRYAKKRKPSSRVAPLPNPPDSQLSDQFAKKKEMPVDLPSIEYLYTNLVEKLQATILGRSSGDDAADNIDMQATAFDEIYSRILVEVEKRALDQALRMLRFVRRKCSSGAFTGTLADALKLGFNRVLDLVNQDIRRHFNGMLSSQLVAPL